MVLINLTPKKQIHGKTSFTKTDLSRLPWWCGGKEFTCQWRNARDKNLIPGSERSSGEGNGNTLRYSCLENSMYRGACQVTVHGVITVPKVLIHFNFNSKV